MNIQENEQMRRNFKDMPIRRKLMTVILAIVGIVFIVWPGPTIALLMILVGLSAILFGVASIAQALALRKA